MEQKRIESWPNSQDDVYLTLLPQRGRPISVTTTSTQYCSDAESCHLFALLRTAASACTIEQLRLATRRCNSEAIRPAETCLDEQINGLAAPDCTQHLVPVAGWGFNQPLSSAWDIYRIESRDEGLGCRCQFGPTPSPEIITRKECWSGVSCWNVTRIKALEERKTSPSMQVGTAHISQRCAEKFL